jgi:hypothetical protein
MDIRLGASAPTSVQVNAGAAVYRYLLYLTPLSAAPATFSIEVKNTSNSAHPVVDLDAFLVLTRVR